MYLHSIKIGLRVPVLSSVYKYIPMYVVVAGNAARNATLKCFVLFSTGISDTVPHM
jgi:hypothetical protein